MIEVVLLSVMLIFFIQVIREKDLLKAVIYLSGSSFCLTLIFFILKAPDIAITQAAIEVVLVTIIFVVAIEKTRRYENE